MNYHVFIVDETTLKYHLEYGFAGTGNKDRQSPFLIDAQTTSIHSAAERILVGMIADISRIRTGDKIIFYLQSKDGREGMFFGVYRAVSRAFFDENDSNNYLVEHTEKGLSYRVLISPDEIYRYGVTEHEYLDSIDGKLYPYQMCWSLIYRKLKGNRGCTMITDYEFFDLLSKLKKKNNNQHASWSNTTYDRTKNCISQGKNLQYQGRKRSIDIEDRLLHKACSGNAFEVHLQALIMQQFDKGALGGLYQFIGYDSGYDFWIGNEVSCGVGMQRIDIMVIQQNANEVLIKIMELKCVQPEPYIITNQIPWYIKWVSEYVAPNYILQGKKVRIMPCIVAQNTNDKNFWRALNSFVPCITNSKIDVAKIKFVPFVHETNKQIIF